ncbi:MAG: tRNA (N(6)-L-threonylcarbamoyladenosine(37)-C(2))-methylthiotransferase MtaB [Candidatus Gastranaerophilales bacterium]|nr:tRNA (N(6)-L-threonylcarbamoyladenosine(37)-C(2))-methylthiotransferase MtaB [Candidatus Gastranaerophilales bacterium]
MPTFMIKTFGCKTNQTESAVMEEKLLQAGFSAAKNVSECDYYIFNSCAVTLEAEKKLLQAVKSFKHNNPQTKIILSGCYAQLHKDEKNPLFDKIFGIYEKPDIVKIIENDTKITVSDINSHKDFRYEKLSNFNRTRATIKIQDGCNNRCSYCTICIARGLSRSCKTEDVIEQINTLSDNGYNEIVLTGIHVGQWGLDFSPKKSFLDLLKEIEKTSIKTYRIGSLDPNEITDELIDFLKKSEKFCPHFHLSLQSLCDKTLKNMNRHYGFEKIKNVVEKLNSSFENVFLGTDIIVGFPQETEEDFNTTFERLKELPLSQIHVFPYSARPNTVAAKMDGQIPQAEKHRRMSLVKEVSEEKHLEFLKKNIGSRFFVTVEKNPDKKTGLYKAVTPNYIKVFFEGTPDIKNKYVQIQIKSVDENSHNVFAETL